MWAYQLITSSSVTTQNKAKNVIFILLTGAISHTDTFDLKMASGVTPSNFQPTMVNGVNWPMGLLPKTGAQLGNMAMVRSMYAHALVHSLAQRWTQIGRNPAAALGNISPNIGSVVAREKDAERTSGQVFPTFLALNSASAAGGGYFPASHNVGHSQSASGLKHTKSFTQDPVLVGGEVDYAIGDDYVNGVIRQRDVFDFPL